MIAFVFLRLDCDLVICLVIVKRRAGPWICAAQKLGLSNCLLWLRAEEEVGCVELTVLVISGLVGSFVVLVCRFEKLIPAVGFVAAHFARDVFQVLVPVKWGLLGAVANLHLHFIDIVLEVPFAFCAVGEDHLSVAVLDAFDPLSLVATAVCPVHFTVAVALILPVLPFIYVATCPLEDALALFPVILVVSLVAVAEWSLSAAPLAFAFLHAAHEVSNVGRPVGPRVLPFTVRFTVEILSCVGVSIGEDVCARTMLEAHIPLSLVSVPVFPSVHPVAMGFALVPLAYIGVVVQSAPDSVAVL